MQNVRIARRACIAKGKLRPRRKRLEGGRQGEIRIQEIGQDTSGMVVLKAPGKFAQVAGDPTLTVRVALDSLNVEQNSHSASAKLATEAYTSRLQGARRHGLGRRSCPVGAAAAELFA